MTVTTRNLYLGGSGLLYLIGQFDARVFVPGSLFESVARISIPGKTEWNMNQRIVGYHQDEYGDWVADLACGHGQHVRHRPPMTNRPWVLTEIGRTEHLGTMLNCRRCEEEG